jgi:hypothetical protein
MIEGNPASALTASGQQQVRGTSRTAKGNLKNVYQQNTALRPNIFSSHLKYKI